MGNSVYEESQSRQPSAQQKETKSWIEKAVVLASQIGALVRLL